MRSGPVVVLVSLMMCPCLASAGTVRPWLGGHGSLAKYNMSDVNGDIGNVNAIVAPFGLEMNEINGGTGLGVAFGLELRSGLSIGLGYDRLFGSSEVGDASGSIKYDFPADAFRVFGQYSFSGAGASGIYLGGSAGLIRDAGSVTVAVTGTGSVSGDVEGSGGLFELFAGGDWWAGARFALTGSGGYRYAKISENKVNGDTVYLANGQKESIDYSGIFARLGFKVALTK